MYPERASTALLLEGWEEYDDECRSLADASDAVRKAVYGAGVGTRLSRAAAVKLDQEALEQIAAAKYVLLLENAKHGHLPAQRALENDGSLVIALRNAVQDYLRRLDGGGARRPRIQRRGRRSQTRSPRRLRPEEVGYELSPTANAELGRLLNSRQALILRRLRAGQSQQRIAQEMSNWRDLLSQATVSRERARIISLLRTASSPELNRLAGELARLRGSSMITYAPRRSARRRPRRKRMSDKRLNGSE